MLGAYQLEALEPRPRVEGEPPLCTYFPYFIHTVTVLIATLYHTLPNYSVCPIFIICEG